MEPQGSLPHLQETVTCPYPEPDQSSPRPSSHFLEIHLNISLQSTPGSSKWSPSLSFPYHNPVCTSPLLSFIRATCPAHLILHDFIIRIILPAVFNIQIFYSLTAERVSVFLYGSEKKERIFRYTRLTDWLL
jgi:hypothetical protein